MNRTALIIVDMLSSYDFEHADQLAQSSRNVIKQIAGLMRRANQEGALVVYVNDNYGIWNSSRESIVDDALHGKHPELVKPIVPHEETPFVIKARHSIFYETPLEYLLRQEGIGRVVLVGQVTEQCILYSALDAYIRHFAVAVAPDACATIHPHLADAAKEMMERNMRVDTRCARECVLGHALTTCT